MDPERWRRIKSLFADALDRSPAARAAFLEAVAADDPVLAGEVRALVAADEKAGAFLSGGPALPPDIVSSNDAREPARLEGRRIGPYRLLSEIGHGGMGAVYRAVRDDDQYQKQVAIKLIRSGGDSSFVQRRFRAERQILAGLEHPNIARLLDGGTTDEGSPYLVMECVDGQPVDRYCDSHRLTTADRLRLFRDICSAVQYAHRKLVVHRDIKPSNILVTEDGTAKLLDFGIAKILEESALTQDGMAATLTGFPLMTPDYASPEQARGEAVTTASDVYSLGIVLYELLAGARPYSLTGRGPEEILRAVCETEPEPPSLAAGRRTRADAGASREAALDPRELAGDLDTIVLKALRKEPDRRYGSCEELSEDLRRYLEGLPVLARKDTVAYRAGKFVRRHRVGVAAVVLVVLSLLGGIAATWRQARIAEANRAQAERRFGDVRKLANSFLFEFHDAIQNLPGATPARALVVRRAAEYLDGLSGEAQQDVALQRELAAAFVRLGEIQGGGGGSNLGDSKGALESYDKALALRNALVARTPAETGDVEGLAELETLLGSFFINTGDLPRAEDFFRSAIQRLEALASGAPAGSDERMRLTRAYHRLGFSQARRGREPDALASLQKAVSYGEPFCAAHPEDHAAQAGLAFVKNDLAERFWRARQFEAAVESNRQARLKQEALLQADPNDARVQRDLAVTLRSGGIYLGAVGKRAESLESYQRAVTMVEAQLAADPQNRWNQSSALVVRRSLGVALVDAGQGRAGIEHLQQAARQGEGIVAEDPSNAFVRNELSVVYENLGGALQETGKGAASEACRTLERALALRQALEREGRASGEYVDTFRAVTASVALCRAGRH